MGPSIQDYLGETLTQELTPKHHDEVWGINMVGNCIRCDAIFWMDDLQSQRDYMPHRLIPTNSIKACIQTNGETLANICGEEVGRWMQGILATPDEIAGEVYNDIIEDMKTLVNKGALQQAPHEIMLAFGAAYQADGQNFRADPNRTLSGLMQVLDKHKTPVITPTSYPEVIENSYDYPLQEIAQLSYEIFGKPYLNNGVAMAIAYAIWKGVKSLKIYGCDFTYPNRDFAESGRACVEAWITAGVMKDMDIGLAPHTSLLDMVGEGGIYGYATQPELTMKDGTVFKYTPKTPDRFGGKFNFYKPENSSGKEPINVVSVAAVADSASGPRSEPDLGPIGIRAAPGANGAGRGGMDNPANV